MIDVNKTCVGSCESDVTPITTYHLNNCKKDCKFFVFVFPGITFPINLT